MSQGIFSRHTQHTPGGNVITNVKCAYGYIARTQQASRSASRPRFYDRAPAIWADSRERHDRYLQGDCSTRWNERLAVLRGDDRSSRAYGSGYSSLGSAVVTRWGVAYRRALTTKAPHRSEGPYRVSSRSSEFRRSDLETVFGKFGLASDSPARTRCDLGVGVPRQDLEGGLFGGVPRRRPEGNLVGGVSHSTR